jgi:hypothetical protein
MSAVPPEDKRAKLVGRRITGYCGHVPAFNVLAPPTRPSPEPSCPATLPTPGKHLRRESVISPSRLTHFNNPTDVQHDVTSSPPPMAARIPPRRASSHLTASRSGSIDGSTARPPPPRAVAGYGGHRAGDQFATGSCVNGPRKTENLTTSMHAERSTAWKQQLAGAAPLPKYPLFRGPTRTSTLGMECFLTN